VVVVVVVEARGRRRAVLLWPVVVGHACLLPRRLLGLSPRRPWRRVLQRLGLGLLVVAVAGCRHLFLA